MASSKVAHAHWWGEHFCLSVYCNGLHACVAFLHEHPPSHAEAGGFQQTFKHEEYFYSFWSMKTHNCTSSPNSAFYKVWLWPFAAISLACYELFEKYLVTLLHSSEAMQSVPLLFWVDMTWNFSAHFCSSRARVVSGRWSWGRRATNVLHDVPDDDRGCLKLILLTATHSMWRRLHIYVIHIIGPHVVPFSSELYYCR